MNILYYCDEHYLYNSRGGGIGSATINVAEEMSKRGHNVYMAGYYPYANFIGKQSHVKNGVTVIGYNNGYRSTPIKKFLFRIIRKIKCTRFIIQKEIDLIEAEITNLINSYNINVLELPDFLMYNDEAKNLRFKKFNISTVIRIHGSKTFLLMLQGVKIPISLENDIRHFCRCDYALGVSFDSLNFVINNISGNCFLSKGVVYNSIEDDFCKLQGCSTNNVILYIGRFIETKGFYSTLKAFNRIGANHRNWKLRLIGGIFDDKQHIVNDEVKKQVEYVDFMSRDKLKAEIDNCSFACLPSYYETLGMTALEFMARTRTVIYTERTAGPEVINDMENGLLVNPENVDQIAEKMEMLINDRILRKTLAKNAYETIQKKFSIKSVCDSLEKFYLNVI